MTKPTDPAPVRRVWRSLFLSDFHLGARSCRPQAILDFLACTEAQTIYLVGDIFDLWHGGRVHWSAQHDAILAELEARAQNGTRIIYLPGNHDAPMRSPGRHFLHFELREAVVHRAADGQGYLVMHGDQCDARILRWHVMTRLGSRLDALFRGMDAQLRRWRRRSDTEGSLIRLAIDGVNTLLAHGSGYERRLLALAGAARMQGVICGHSHKPALRDHGGLTYANCGDWVDSLTALAEDHSGALHLLQWEAALRTVPRPDHAAPAHRPSEIGA